VTAMILSDFIAIMIVIIVFCVSGLLYLVFDYFNTIKHSKEAEEQAKQQVEKAKQQKEQMEQLQRIKTLAENLESAGRYEDAAREYYKIGMLDKAEDCMKKAKIEEAKNLETAGRYEDAAKKYDELKMWDKAGDCRRMLKTNYVVSANLDIAKVGTISMNCPHCGASQPIATKTNEVTCKFCGKNYVIPKKVLDLL
jgi:tetratricopeptide (TPR) repeat protein